MANAKANGERYSYAVIDTAPGADGYWCDAVSMSSKNTRSLFFSIRGDDESSTSTISIQYKTPESGSAWQDYSTDETLAPGARFILEDWGAGVKWRAGVKNGDFAGGEVRVGFDW